MPNTLVITVMGANRPGLVAEIASTVAAHGGNWVESRLVRLGGQFAGVLRVEIAEGEASPLAEALEKLGEMGLRSLIKSEEAAPQTEPRSRLVRLEIIGSDRPGILKAISSALARHEVDIEELATERRSAPMSGELLFEARALVHVPPEATLRGIRADLEKIAGDLMVDLLLGEATGSRV